MGDTCFPVSAQIPLTRGGCTPRIDNRNCLVESFIVHKERERERERKRKRETGRPDVNVNVLR